MSVNNYITWSAQTNAPCLDVASVEDTAFILESGKRVVDFISTSFQANFGHKNKKIIEAIHKQLDTMAIASPKAMHDLRENSSARLIQLLGLGSGKLFYTVSGAESVENALKMARQIKGRKKILARSVSYHGASLGALSVTGDWRNESHATVDDWTVRIPEPKDDPAGQRTRQIIIDNDPSTIAGVCVETITGANGVFIAPQTWWSAIQSICKEFDLFLIVDEVLSGFGRCQAPFAFQLFGVKPDFVCMSKGITGGYIPFGALWTHQDVANYYQDEVLCCGLTSYAHPLGLAAMNAVLDLFADNEFLTKVELVEACFAEYMEQLSKHQNVAEIRYRGLLGACDLKNEVDATWQDFVDNGVYLLRKPKRLIFAPALVMSGDDMKSSFETVKKLIS